MESALENYYPNPIEPHQRRNGQRVRLECGDRGIDPRSGQTIKLAFAAYLLSKQH